MVVSVRSIGESFVQGERATCNNTVSDGSVLLLHGYRVCWHSAPDWSLSGRVVCVHLAGWDTVTTRQRVRSVLDALGVLDSIRFGSLGEGVSHILGRPVLFDPARSVLVVPLVASGVRWDGSDPWVCDLAEAPLPMLAAV